MCSPCLATKWNFALSTSLKTYFGLVKRLKMSSQRLATTGNIASSTSLKSNLACTTGRKWFQSYMGALETSFYRFHPRRILGLSRDEKLILSSIRPLETSLYQLEKVAFRLAKEQKMTSKFHTTTWIIGFSTSPKSSFGLGKRHKMSSQWIATNWNMAFLNSKNRILCWSRH